MLMFLSRGVAGERMIGLSSHVIFAAMGYTIREALSDKDWQQGCAVLHRVYVGEGFTRAEMAAQFQTRERMEGEGTFLIAVRDDGDVIGAVLYLHEGSTMQQLAQQGEREFRMLAVHPDARGEGVGEALVRECIRRAGAEAVTGLVLWTQPIMHSAQRLYDRLGFVRQPQRDMPDARGWTRLVYLRPCTS